MRPSLLFSLLAVFCMQATTAVTISTSPLPNGTVGAPYSASITAKSGCTPYVWTVTGTLPPGVALTSTNNTQTLSLSGTPTTAGSYVFTASVRGCGGHTSKVSYTVAIQAAAVHLVNLHWSASTSTEIAGYNLYRGTDGVNWQKINSGGLIASTLYSDSSVANGTTYYYTATAMNLLGMESAKAAPIQVRIP